MYTALNSHELEIFQRQGLHSYQNKYNKIIFLSTSKSNFPEDGYVTKSVYIVNFSQIRNANDQFVKSTLSYLSLNWCDFSFNSDRWSKVFPH